jgi:hypothetical protein
LIAHLSVASVSGRSFSNESPATPGNLDIGNFSKRTLLTGAGWTRNWGGRLAAEIWQDLIGHRAIQKNSRLRGLLLAEPSFEAALGQVQAEPFTPADHRTFEGALLDAFIAVDREVARAPHDPWINVYKVRGQQGAISRPNYGCSAGRLFDYKRYTVIGRVTSLNHQT